MMHTYSLADDYINKALNWLTWVTLKLWLRH